MSHPSWCVFCGGLAAGCALPLALLALFLHTLSKFQLLAATAFRSFEMGIQLPHDSLYTDKPPPSLRVALRADSVFERDSSKARFHVYSEVFLTCSRGLKHLGILLS